MPNSFHCPHCHRAATLVTPPAWTRALVWLAWFNAAVLVLCAGMIGPLIMLVLPALFACGAGLVSGAHALADEPTTCGACGKIVERAAAAPARARAVRAGLVRAA